MYSYDIYYDLFGLNFGQFGQGHERVGRLQQSPALRLVVEGAGVRLGVAVQGAEGGRAPAHEGVGDGQLLAAVRAPAPRPAPAPAPAPAVLGAAERAGLVAGPQLGRAAPPGPRGVELGRGQHGPSEGRGQGLHPASAGQPPLTRLWFLVK